MSDILVERGRPGGLEVALQVRQRRVQRLRVRDFGQDNGVSPGNQTCEFHGLGREKEIAGVTLMWHSRGLAPAQLPVAALSDGRTYCGVDKVVLAGHGANTAVRSFLPQTGRYVRLTLDNGGCSVSPGIVEVGLHRVEQGDAAVRRCDGRAGIRTALQAPRAPCRPRMVQH